MEQIEFFDENTPNNESDSRFEYYQFVRLGFKINGKNLRFSCKTEPEKIDRLLLSPTKVVQVIEGYSEAINNQELLTKSVYERQPNFNKLFDGTRIYIYFKEEKKEEKFPYLKPHNLRIYYNKNGDFHNCLIWKIDDRSFFTRLVGMTTAHHIFKCIITLGKKDDTFKKIIENNEKLPSLLNVNGIFLS
jgi:hypothetical protein